MSPSSPSVDRSGSTWHARFAGIGKIAIDPDGAIDVTVEGPDPGGLKERALASGWGELLSHAQRGFSMAAGATVVHPAHGTVLLCGEPADIARVVLDLVGHDWRLASDYPTPTRWIDGELVVFPRKVPLVVGARLAADAGIVGSPVRHDSNALYVDVPRTTDPTRLTHVVQIRRRRPTEEELTVLLGHRRFERAANIMVGGILVPTSVEDPVAEHLRLAEIPSAVLRIDGRASTDALLGWVAA